MATSKSQSKTMDEYVAKFPKNVRDVLQELRRVIRESAPKAEETISYGIPTFDLNGRHLVHFAAYKNHVGFYPTSSGIKAFKKELSPFKTSRGTAQFPLSKPIPFDLVKKIVKFRVKENESKRK
ncbi:MAG TPA: DUF1801 domain-containing protein [Candidatus Bathyarchaeia archaeon]|nr:DUF1801 domain-containing protein [Candidatus Bathyarchaeia archaeon]